MEPNVIHLATVTSTQDVARAMTPRRVGAVIIADVQEKGRGRRGHVWLSPRGGLYVSIVMRSDPLLSLRAGIAVAHALQRLGIDARLKWPNDVLVKGKKIAGILIEASGGTAIVGIGVNIESAPLAGSTCIAAEAGRIIARDDLVLSIVQEMDTSYLEDILKTYRKLCATIGKDVAITMGNEKVSGLVVDVDEGGHLLLKTAEELRIISSGECAHLDVHSSADTGKQDRLR